MQTIVLSSCGSMDRSHSTGEYVEKSFGRTLGDGKMARFTADESNLTRRVFLGAGSAAAVWGAALARGANVDTTENHAVAGVLLDVRECGARGDGVTDDTQAIREAVARAAAERIGTVFLPAGTFLLSDALRLPSHIRLQGVGAGLTRLQAVSETRFPLVRPDPRTAEIRQRRTMLTTASAGQVRETVVENICLADLTVDWNHCPTEGFGSSCVLIDSADGCRLERVRFERCLPSDHPRRLEEMRGSGFRSECIMFSNARHGLMDGCELADSGYRPLSVAYGSLDITFQNGRIVAEQPIWRHAFAEVHGDGIPRDERFVRSQLKLLNSTFVLQGGTAQDGVCSHTGTVYVENCDFFILDGTEHFGFIIKPFDASRRCQCLNNRFHCHGNYQQRFAIIGSIGDKTNEELLFVGNIVDVAFRAGTGDRAGGRGLVDFGRSEVRCRVQDNQFLIQCEEPVPMPAVRLENARGFTVAGNLIEFRGGASEIGPVGISVKNSRAGTITGNVVIGDCQQAIQVEEEMPGVLVYGNSAESGSA
jgi:hypothetical protein